MADRVPTDAVLDAFIDGVLRDETMLPAPADLHRKVQKRVHFAALQARERSRFRYSLLSALGALLVVLAGTTILVTLTHFNLLYHHGVSGGMGFFDYYVNRFDASWASHVGTYALLLTMGLSFFTLWAGLVAFRIQLRLSATHPSPVSSGRSDVSMAQLH
jgi:hypothetical protein